MDEVAKWTYDNKNVLNAPKTKTMFVTGKRLASKFTNLTELNEFESISAIFLFHKKDLVFILMQNINNRDLTQ